MAITAVQGIAHASQDASHEITPGQSMTIDVRLQLGPAPCIIPKRPLQRRAGINGRDQAEPPAHAFSHGQLAAHTHALDARGGLRRHQRGNGREQRAIEVLLRQLQLDRRAALSFGVALGSPNDLARSLNKRRMARDIVHMHSLERLPVGRLCAGLLTEHAHKRTDVDGLDREIRVLRGRRRRQDQRRHPRQKREPRGARLHIALPSPITRRHALIWPRCIIW